MQLPRNNYIQHIKLWCVQHAYTIAFLLVLCCFFGYNIGKIYGFTILPDEFGYWSYAAAIAGYDWSEIVSLNSYYSYGYSVILLPVFILFQNGLTAYRAAVVVNFVMVAGIGFLLQYLMLRLFPDVKGRVLSVFAAVITLYPPLLLYARTTMAETLLAFLYVLAVVVLYQYLKRGKMSGLTLFLVVLVYLHFVHMRTIALFIAGILTVLTDRLFFAESGGKSRWDKKYLFHLMIVAAVVVLFVLGMSVRGLILDMVYEGDSEIYQVNDYRGQFGKFQYIMTLEGFENLVASISGKILYLGLATYGTAFWGLWHAWKMIIHAEERSQRVVWCFIFLSATGALAISAVYSIYPGRVDALAYGRYHEYVFPVLMAAGMYEMWHTHRLWKGTFWIVCLELCMLVPVLCSLYKYHQTSLHACMVFGMSYLYDAGDSDPVKFYLGAYGFDILLTMIVTTLTAVSRKKESRMPILFLVTIMEVVLALRAASVVTDTGSIGAYRDSVVADKIAELLEDTPDGGASPVRRVLYLDRSGACDIDRIQFLLRDTQISVLDRRENIDGYSESEMSTWDLVLMDYRDDYGRELCKQYAYTLSSGHFILYYNILVQ